MKTLAEKPGEQTVKGYLKWCEENDMIIDGWIVYFLAVIEGFRKQQEENAKQKNIAQI